MATLSVFDIYTDAFYTEISGTQKETRRLGFCLITGIHLLKLLEKIPINVPEEISVAGFDDALLAKLFSLTTVTVSRKEMGVVAVKKLINQIQGTTFGPTNTILPLNPVVRNSIAKPNYVQ
ncbi:MAG: substrate-binding domain-containing protein [Candidatus Omnitrophota bacterium]